MECVAVGVEAFGSPSGGRWRWRETQIGVGRVASCGRAVRVAASPPATAEFAAPLCSPLSAHCIHITRVSSWAVLQHYRTAGTMPHTGECATVAVATATAANETTAPTSRGLDSLTRLITY